MSAQTRSEMTYGSLSGHAVGIIMKEMVRRAIVVIRRERFTFEREVKVSYGGEMNDLVTSADKAAQQVYLRSITECFPEFGVIAEEGELSIPCTRKDYDAYFTVDPLDGTKAYGRRQSHGIGTMISLVRDGQVVAAYVGDITTQEIYGFRPDSDKVHRISEFEHSEILRINPDRHLAQQNLLLREMPHKYSAFVNRQILDTNVFKSIEISGGSIGIAMARLWKGELAAMIMTERFDTPWDDTPIYGICQKLGFVYLEVSPLGIRPYSRPLLTKVDRTRNCEILVVHESRIEELFSQSGQEE